MPDLKDPQKQIPVAPKFFLGRGRAEAVPRPDRPTQRRALAASYVTGQDNPWFAKAFVNRVWYALMGEGFYNPVDDLGPDADGQRPRGARRPRRRSGRRGATTSAGSSGRS